MLLLGVRVKCRVAQVGLVTILALVVSAINIIFAASSASGLLEAFVLVTIVLAIIGHFLMIVELGILTALQSLLIVGQRWHGLLTGDLCMNLVRSLSELLQIWHITHSLHLALHRHDLLHRKGSLLQASVVKRCVLVLQLVGGVHGVRGKIVGLHYNVLAR